MSPLTRLYSWTRSRADRNSSGEYLANFAQRAVDSVPPRALVLDAGSSPGTPYYFCFGKHRHESADIQAHAAVRFLSIDPLWTDSTVSRGGFWCVKNLVELEGHYGTFLRDECRDA